MGFKAACRTALEQIDVIVIAALTAKGRKKAARDRLEALNWLADRGYGRATQPVAGEEGGPIGGGRRRGATSRKATPQDRTRGASVRGRANRRGTRGRPLA